jgi:PPOX class probable F420-dependent enzyme
MADQAVSSVEIPERLRDLLSDDVRAFANLALVRKDGRPHVTPVWFAWDGEHIIVNTARNRVKDRILHRHPRVAMSVMDPSNPYRYLLITGQVVDETEQGGYEQISALNVKYHGNPDYPKRPGEVRVTYRIRPETVYPKK